MNKIMFFLLFVFLLHPCFSQQLNDTELVRQKISLLMDSYNKNKSIINSQKLIEILDIMNNIFNKSYNYRFMNVTSHGNEILRVFHNTEVIADLFLDNNFRLNNFDIMRYVYLTGTLFQNKRVINVKITAINETSENICFSFNYTDIDNGIVYVYEYYTNQYEMLIISECELLDAPSYPLIKRITIYNRSIFNDN